MKDLLMNLMGITDTKIQVLESLKKLAIKLEELGSHLTSEQIQEMIDGVYNHAKRAEIADALKLAGNEKVAEVKK